MSPTSSAPWPERAWTRRRRATPTVETYDRAYRRANFDEYTQWFPLHDKCHAGYDLVPGWVNPTLVVLPVLAVACLAYAVRLAGSNEEALSQPGKGL